MNELEELKCDVYRNSRIFKKKVKYATIDTSQALSFIHQIKCFVLAILELCFGSF